MPLQTHKLNDIVEDKKLRRKLLLGLPSPSDLGEQAPEKERSQVVCGPDTLHVHSDLCAVPSSGKPLSVR